jgi:hypothetical protein
MRRPLAPAVLLLLASCCGYSVRALLPPHLKTIAILPVENQTLKPGLEVQFTDSLIARFQRDGSLRLSDAEKADVALHCRITDYDKAPQSYVTGQEVSNWQVTVSAKVEADDQVRGEKLWEGPISVTANYDAVRQKEDDGIGEALGKLADEIMRRTLIAW